MKIKDYYNVDPHNGNIISPRLSRRVVSDDAKLPGRSACRVPLRDIHRYNRIVKKALLDESTKRFIVTANSTYKRLVIAIEKCETQLEEGGEFIRNLSTGQEQSGHSHNNDLLKAYCKKGKLKKSIQNEPNQGDNGHTSISVRDTSQAAKLLAEQAQAMVYYVLFYTLYLSNCDEKGQPLGMDTATNLRQNASNTLEQCDAVRADNPETLGFLQDDIEKARRLLNGGTFYSFVTSDEKRQVYEAMATQFSGTGHGY
ncbi:hypothetical protein ETB97_008890 [Aspergillus alliaceus]|uniref:Uncharacterized protein n=1 Tax=Petromyces alliaceus TaxID=209559 RepID=A0A8H6E0Z6_PETAA|nr:hypothetical protein ETB97_008890 [Aspergillus burnettii]